MHVILVKRGSGREADALGISTCESGRTDPFDCKLSIARLKEVLALLLGKQSVGQSEYGALAVPRE